MKYDDNKDKDLVSFLKENAPIPKDPSKDLENSIFAEIEALAEKRRGSRFNLIPKVTFPKIAFASILAASFALYIGGAFNLEQKSEEAIAKEEAVIDQFIDQTIFTEYNSDEDSILVSEVNGAMGF